MVIPVQMISATKRTMFASTSRSLYSVPTTAAGSVCKKNGDTNCNFSDSSIALLSAPQEDGLVSLPQENRYYHDGNLREMVEIKEINRHSLQTPLVFQEGMALIVAN